MECTSCNKHCQFHHHLQRYLLPWMIFCSRVFLYICDTIPCCLFYSKINSLQEANISIFNPVCSSDVILSHPHWLKDGTELLQGDFRWNCQGQIASEIKLCLQNPLLPFLFAFSPFRCSHFAYLLSVFLKALAEKVMQQVGENSSYFQGTCSPAVPLEHSLPLLCTGGQSVSELSPGLAHWRWASMEKEKLPAGQKARKKPTRKWDPAGVFDSANLSQKSSVSHFLHTLRVRVKCTSDQC